MADIVSTKKTLQLVAEFIDGDTRTITLENPKASLTAADIDATTSLMLQGLIGDKTGAHFYRWKTAAVIDKNTIELDIS